MKKLFILISFITTLGMSAAYAADWKNDIDAAVKYNNFNKINIIAAEHPEAQGAIAVRLLQLAQSEKNPQREAQLFKAAAPFVGRASTSESALVGNGISGVVKVVANPTFKKGNTREANEILLTALSMSSQPNIVAANPKLHGEVLTAADDFLKANPQDADKRLLERVSMAQTGSANNAPASVINTNPSVTVTNVALAPTGNWKNDIDAAVKHNDFNKINIVAASNPESQGPIAIYLLQLAQSEKNPQRQVDLFKTATPFVGRVSTADAGTVAGAITNMLKIAADPTFQKGHPQEAGDIFLNALLMSNQPNIVAYDPTLHSEVLAAADDFIKTHPLDADKRLLEQVSLAESGLSPKTSNVGVINPSAE